MLLAAGIIFLVLPILTITAYVFCCTRKQYLLRKLFKIIQDESYDKPTREKTADRAIQILHANKWLVPPEPIRLNVQNSGEFIVIYELLKGEARFLLKNIDNLRNQKSYLNMLPPNQRSEILKFIQEGRNLLKILDFVPLNPNNKIIVLVAVCRAILAIYLSLPDENNNRELNFIPLFEIIDKTPNRTLIIFP